ncbi:MAG: hypothetical protein B9S32_10590 [Verrucomicrobia bacterium Tous-C9LFEB]|nr:MAG: hypothetical protein B9S32_10590 [Verrucomicrobia bacterium Tous-C9LFEB]
MKTTLILTALIGLFLVSPRLQAGDVTFSDAPAPAIVLNGLDTYRTGTSGAALDVWLAGSALGKAQDTRDALQKQFTQFETTNGKMLRFEQIGGVSPSPSVRVNWYTICYSKGVAFVEFTSYQGKSSWIITNIRLSTDYRDILPAWQIPIER